MTPVPSPLPHDLAWFAARVAWLEHLVNALKLAVHGMLTWTLVWWTFVLGQPGDTFATSKSYRNFLSIATEETWTVFLGVVAALGLAGMFWRKLRLVSALTMAFVHALIAGLLATGPMLGTGTGVYAGISATAFLFLWLEQSRLNREARGL